MWKCNTCDTLNFDTDSFCVVDGTAKSKPALYIKHKKIDFGEVGRSGNCVSVAFRITNNGTDTLSGGIRSPVPGYVRFLSPTTFKLEPGESSDIVVSLTNSVPMPEGGKVFTFHDWIIVASNGGSEYVSGFYRAPKHRLPFMNWSTGICLFLGFLGVSATLFSLVGGYWAFNTWVLGKLVPRTITIYADHDIEAGCIEGQDWPGCRNIKISNYGVGNEYPEGTISADFFSNGYAIRRVFLYFDTTSIPEMATISSATLSFYAGPYQEGSNLIHVIQSFGEKWYSPSDFNNIRALSGGSVDANKNQWNELVFNPSGLESIKPNGWTNIVLIHDYDLNDILPTNPNNLVISRANSGHRPYMTIKYLDPK